MLLTYSYAGHRCSQQPLLPELFDFRCFSLPSIVSSITASYHGFFVDYLSFSAPVVFRIVLSYFNLADFQVSSFGFTTVFISKREFMLVGWMVLYLISMYFMPFGAVTGSVARSDYGPTPDDADGISKCRSP